MEIVVPVIFLFLWKHGQAESQCGVPSSQPNFKLQGHVIQKHSMQTSDQCTEKCALNADCHSINFYSSQRICELNNANHLSNPESLVPSAGGQYMNYLLRAVPRCSNKLCSHPLVCKVDEDGQSHKCVSCEDVKKEVLSFPRKSVVDKVEHEFQADFQLTAFTVSMWVQADPSTNFHTLFSYATPSEDNEFSICLDKSYTELGIAGTFKRVYPPLIDGKWHHLCVTWQNLDGAYKFYIDGVQQVPSGSGSMHQGHVIQNGALFLGQEQDSYKGGFSSSQSFQGNLASVNMWDRVLTAQEVSALAKKCPTEEGNVLRWSTLKTKRSSGVKLTCLNQCI